MKSKRAKECADRYIATGVHKGVHRYKYVIQAIELAEEDAEERHLKQMQRRGNAVYEVLCRNYGDSIALSLGEEIESVLLNGGQSDE